MKKQFGYTLIELLVVIQIIGVVLYGFNIYKLTQCDFEADWKCEIVHGVGLIPPIGVFTAFVGSDN